MRFSEVIGQQSVKQRLLQSVKEERVSHALMFLGPEGSGNLAIALAFAQYLVCENRSDTDSCGECGACIKMSKLVHPDVTFSFPVALRKEDKAGKKIKSIDCIKEFREAVLENPYLIYTSWVEYLGIENKQGLISVDEAADIISRLSLKSVESVYKIVIIWIPEKMNGSSANKLLKILEEPPENTLFFLVAEQFEQLLPTITSRIQLVKVNRIKDDDMISTLTRLHEQSPEVARRIAHRVNGNYNEALNILSNDTAESDLNQWFIAWMRACYRADIVKINELCEDFVDRQREMQKVYLEHAQQVARECLLINYADRSLVRIEGKEFEDLKRFAPFIHLENAEGFVEELNSASYHIERNANARMLFTDLSFKLHKLIYNPS
ncbi:MAG TPA: DNA polymerase III subunit delta [Bacteroidia bacterium]|nr:DNA polymerase III subunit delta [Bacteroidia bacterium]HNP98179.1 DNA polymerase III subunit delta [Bacteroidia bacterium]